MKHPVSRDLHSYWNALRAGRTAPERSEIDPVAIRQILAFTFVLGVSGTTLTGRRQASFRLSGTRLDALFGHDLKGRDFSSLWSRRDADGAEALLDIALDDRAAAVAAVQGGPPGYEPIALELLLLPLRHHGKTHARILGSLSPAVNPGWMGLRPVAPLELGSFRAMTGRPSAPEPSASAPRPDGRVDAPIERPRAVTQVGPFRVYEGGRIGRSPAGSPV